MTQQPEQEYRITEEHLKRIEELAEYSKGHYINPDWLFEAVKFARSRPIAAATPNLHTCHMKEIRNDVEFCHYFGKPFSEHDAAIRKEAYEQGAREERENCIIELLSYLSDYMPKTTRGAQYKHRAKKMIESLRNNEVGK